MPNIISVSHSCMWAVFAKLIVKNKALTFPSTNDIREGFWFSVHVKNKTLELTDVHFFQTPQFGSNRHVLGLALLVFSTVLNLLVLSRMLR